MNRFLKPIMIGLGVLALGACETTGGAGDTALFEQAQGACPSGADFNAALCSDYVQLATEENNPYADYTVDAADRDFYANRAIAAAGGQTVLPTDVAARQPFGTEPQDDVNDARNRLMAALDGGGRTKAPAAAARAQSQYDCWLEQLQEGYQPQDIARCRQGFYDALAQVEAALRPAPVAPVVDSGPTRPEPFLVFFDFDMSNITPESARVISEAASRARSTGAVAIQVIGHADRSGPTDYNQRLSIRRANAVRDELVRNGIAADTITIEGRGETDPLVPTADGVREPQNRRAEGIWIYR